VPDPPKYTACIAHLKAAAAKPAKGQKAPTESELKSECEQQYKSLQQEVLGFLISSSWVLGEAKALGVKVSDKQVREQFLHIKHQQFPKPAEFEKFLSTSGQTVSDLLLRVKLNMLSQKIQQKIVKQKATISKAEAEKYYAEHKSTYGTPERRNVEIILTKTEAQAASAKKEVEGGKSFASVAKKVSIDPTTKAKGGLITETVKGSEEKDLDNALFSAKVGQLGGPLKTQFGYYVYEVLKVNPGNQQPFSSVEKTIKQTVATQKQQKALSTFIKDFKKKWQAKTDCRSGYVVADCKQYKAPKTKSGASSTGASEEG
jgi:foldase protein PrsA